MVKPRRPLEVRPSLPARRGNTLMFSVDRRSVSGQCQVSVRGQCQVSVRSVSGQCQVFPGPRHSHQGREGSEGTQDGLCDSLVVTKPDS